jgi:hypothetical protein
MKVNTPCFGKWVISFYISGSMRQGSNNQTNRRGRGRGHNHNNNRRHNHGGNRNQNYDSNGPQGRIRGTAKQVFEKYLQLAKDAISAGDRVLAESLFQHADHYGRIAALYAPKPKSEQDENFEAQGADDDVQTDDDDGNDDAERVTKSFKVDIEDADTSTDDAEKPAEKAVEEKPKRRAPTRRTTTRKKVEDDKPKLGGGSNAVPDFLARPVDVDSKSKEDEPAAEVEEKPKRRATTRRTTTRKTTTEKSDAPKTTRTRRKKADDADASTDTEKEAS